MTVALMSDNGSKNVRLAVRPSKSALVRAQMYSIVKVVRILLDADF